MWWLLKIVFFVALLVLLVFVAISNDATVDVNLLRWHFPEVRIFLVMLISGMVGLSFGLMFTGVREVQWRMLVGRHVRERAELEREVQHLRQEPLKGLDETPAVGNKPVRTDR